MMPNGEVGGQSVEAFNAIAERADLTVEYHVSDTWQDVLLALENGRATVVPELAVTEERKGIADFSVPLGHNDIVLFRRREDSDLFGSDGISGRRVGALETGTAVPLLTARPDVDLRTYITVKQVLDALLQKEVDFIAAPKPVVQSLAQSLRVTERLQVVGAPLITTDTAIAVRKDHLLLLHRLNTAAKTYRDSPQYLAILHKWGDLHGRPPSLSSVTWIVVLILSTIVIVVGVWKTFRAQGSEGMELPRTDGRELGHRLRRRGVLLTLILVISIAATAGSTLGLLYRIAFEKQRERLVELVQSQASLMNTMAHFNARYATNYPGGTTIATIDQIKTALSRYQGIGEFTLARRIGDDIAFILRQRAWDRYQPSPVPLDSDLAEPMRQALLGRSGTLIGKDYRGVQVLAAFEPVPALGIGVVAKVDIDEIRAPFVEAAFTTGAIGFLVIISGSMAFITVGDPLVRQLVNREHSFAAIVQHAGVGIALIDADADRRIVNANDRFAEILGLTAPIVTGTPLADILEDKTKSPHLTHPWRDLPADASSTSTEVRLVRRNGGTLWAHIVVSRVGTAGQRPERWVIVLDDITDKKQAEALKEDVERVIRHDLRSPIAATLSGIEVLRLASDLTDDQHRTLDMLERANRRQLTMLDMSMTLNRIEAGTFKMTPASVDFTAVLEEVTEELNHVIAKADSMVRITGDTNLHAIGDVWLCRTMFSNLVRNALEALPADHQVVDIILSSTGQHAVIHVDNPGNVPATIRHRFFEKYVTSGKQQGTGLGTYSAFMMARAQGGDIALDTSRPGRTRITVRLPLAASARQPEDGPTQVSSASC